MLDKNRELRLLDLTNAIDSNEEVANYYCGSLEYMAPEVMDKPQPGEVFHLVLQGGMDERDLPQYDAKADIWSLGVLLFEMLSGFQPFVADSLKDMKATLESSFEESVNGVPAFIAKLAKSGVSESCIDFLQRCLQRDPFLRADAATLLRHPWVMRVGSVRERRSLELQHSSRKVRNSAAG